MQTAPRLLDVAALLSDLPEYHLYRDHVGTVVEVLDDVYEIDFADDDRKA